MRNDTIERDAPKPITPPSGDVEVYVYDAERDVAERTLWCGEDSGRAATSMRKAQGHACMARGGVVCGVKYGVPARLHDKMKAAVKAAHDAAHAVEVTHAISPVTGEVVTGAHDFEGDDEGGAPVPKKRRTPKAKPAIKNDSLCTNCEQEPRARATYATRPEEITWGARCRKATCERRRKDAAKLAEAPAKKQKKTSKKVASKAPAKRRSTDPGEILVEVLAGLRGDQITEERVTEIVNDALSSVLGTAVREIVREELATIFASLKGRA